MPSSGRRGKAGDRVGQSAEGLLENEAGPARKKTNAPEATRSASPVLPSGDATTTTGSAN